MRYRWKILDKEVCHAGFFQLNRYRLQHEMFAGGCSERIALYCGRVDASGAGGIHGLEHEGEDIRVRVLSVVEALVLLDGRSVLSAMTVIALQWFRANHEALRRRWLAE